MKIDYPPDLQKMVDELDMAGVEAYIKRAWDAIEEMRAAEVSKKSQKAAQKALKEIEL
jgi:hypothetical protein